MDPGTAAFLIAPWPRVQVKTWKMARAGAPGTLSTKAIFVPSSESTGDIEIVEGHKIGVASASPRSADRYHPEHDVVIEAIGRCGRIEGKLGRIHMIDKARPQRQTPVALPGVVYRCRMGIGPVKNI